MDTKAVKVVLIGDSGVGKSCICNRFINGNFSDVEATIGAAFLTQTMRVDDRLVKFQVWDTAGQERYRSLVSMYYRGTKAAILVFDICDKKSFDGAQKWADEIRERGEGNIVVVLCGNKTDLKERRTIKTKDAQWLAEKNGLLYIETSAKSGSNVKEMFVKIARQLPIEERKRLQALLHACRLQMQILDIETSLSRTSDPALEARLASARQKMASTGRSKDVVGKSNADLASILTQTSLALGHSHTPDSKVDVSRRRTQRAAKSCC